MFELRRRRHNMQLNEFPCDPGEAGEVLLKTDQEPLQKLLKQGRDIGGDGSDMGLPGAGDTRDC